MRRKVTRRLPDDPITASEVAAFVYCPEAWRLEHGLGLPAGNDAARKAGIRDHARNTAAEQVADVGIVVGRLLVVLAGLALLMLLLWRVLR